MRRIEFPDGIPGKDPNDARANADYADYVESEVKGNGSEPPREEPPIYGEVSNPVGIVPFLDDMVARYVLIQNGQLVGDRKALSGGPEDGLIRLTDFKAAYAQNIEVRASSGKEPIKKPAGALWQSKLKTTRVLDTIYDPTSPDNRILTIAGSMYFNTYRRPNHSPMTGNPDEFLRHCEHVIPDPTERELFYDWVAFKLKNPGKRPYSMVMVADLPVVDDGNKGERYGIGRSMISDALAACFQDGVRNITLGDLTGIGGQSDFDDWKEGTQLIAAEEAKMSEQKNWAAGSSTYEHLKLVVDTKPSKNVRVKPKYGRIRYVTTYYSVIIFTNHADALTLPVGDRRFCVIDNATTRRTDSEYADMAGFLENQQNISNLYHWLMTRNISEFKHARPPMTPAKNLMIESSKTSSDEVWSRMLEVLTGAIVTKDQLVRAAELVCGSDEELAKRAMAMASQKWKRLPKLNPDADKGGRVMVDGKQCPARILRNVDNWRSYAGDTGSVMCTQEATKNTGIGINIVMNRGI
jgi:hypothetical protein